jgi:hypothetical protein
MTARRRGHLVVAGAGSGGSLVLEALATDASLASVAVFDHDTLVPENVVRHLGGHSAVGLPKVEVVRRRLNDLRPDLPVSCHVLDITSPAGEAALDEALGEADVALCGVDNEGAKLAFNTLCLKAGVPWTLGEVLAGGVGGLVHVYRPGESACYGCVASFLGRRISEKPPARDYAAAGEAFPAATRIPASKASIAFIAALHALETARLLTNPRHAPRGEVTIIGLVEEPGLFEGRYAGRGFEVPRDPDCLLCSTAGDTEGAFQDAFRRLIGGGKP